jgi:putative ABC transport system substrate-binding protein
MIRRRDVITSLGGMAAMGLWPSAARAQQPGRVRRVAFISGASPASVSKIVAGFPQGMRELGYVEGKDVIIEWRFAEGRYDRFPGIASELVKLNVDVIVLGTPAAIRPVQNATSTIPIVMGYSTDPVGNGFVTSLARPGGNTTGLASSLDDIVSKQLELLATIIPNLARVGYLGNPDNPNFGPVLVSAQASAARSGIALVPVEARSPRGIEDAIGALARQGVNATVVISDALLNSNRLRITEMALRARLATIFSQREYVEDGGLMAYGERLFDFFRRSASYVDKILKGAKPADLPIEQPTRFYLTINLKTAKAIGLSIPESFLLRADEVIE